MFNIPHDSLFIVLEGGEGAGKSTIIQFLKNAFERQNHPVTVFREPGGTPFSEDVRDVFFSHQDLSPETSVHLMNAQRQHNIEKIIIPAMEKKHIVIADRFTASTLVYQGLLNNSYDQVNDLMLDIEAFTIFVDVPPEVGLKRIKDNNRETNYFDEMALEKHQRIYDAYLELEKLKPETYWDVHINGLCDLYVLEVLMSHFANVIMDEVHNGNNTHTLKKLFKDNQDDPRYTGNLDIFDEIAKDHQHIKDKHHSIDQEKEKRIEKRVFKQLRENRNLTYQKAGQQVGLTASRMHDMEKRAERIIKRVVYQPEPLCFLEIATQMDDVKTYLQHYHITKHTFISYILDAVTDNDWITNVNTEQKLLYGIELLELERATYNTLIRWSSIRTINDVLNTCGQELDQIRQVSRKRRNHIIDQTQNWCEKNGIDIQKYNIVALTQQPEPMIKEHYGHTSDAPIGQLDLPKRLNDALIDNNLTTINDIINKTPGEIFALNGVGHKALQKLIKQLDYYFEQVFNHDPKNLENNVRTIDFNVRIRHTLNRCHIKTIQELLDTPYTDIKYTRNVGEKTLTELMNKLNHWANENNIDISQTELIKSKKETH